MLHHLQVPSQDYTDASNYSKFVTDSIEPFKSQSSHETKKMSKSQPLQQIQAVLPRLAKLTGSLPGLDASLMLVQYSTPAVIAVLMGLASFRDKYPALRLSLRRAAAEKGVAVGTGGAGLRLLAAAWARVGLSIGDARVIMRAFGT